MWEIIKNILQRPKEKIDKVTCSYCGYEAPLDSVMGASSMYLCPVCRKPTEIVFRWDNTKSKNRCWGRVAFVSRRHYGVPRQARSGRLLLIVSITPP